MLLMALHQDILAMITQAGEHRCSSELLIDSLGSKWSVIGILPATFLLIATDLSIV